MTPPLEPGAPLPEGLALVRSETDWSEWKPETLVTATEQVDGEEVPVWRSLPADRPAVELQLPGANPPKECQHSAEDVMVEPMVALIEDEPPRWEVRLKAICRCGVTFAVAREGRPPRDGSEGTVLVLTPLS